MRILRPRTKWGRATLVVRRIERVPPRSALDHRFCVRIEAERLGDVFSLVFAFCAVWLAFRWACASSCGGCAIA